MKTKQKPTTEQLAQCSSVKISRGIGTYTRYTTTGAGGVVLGDFDRLDEAMVAARKYEPALADYSWQREKLEVETVWTPVPPSRVPQVEWRKGELYVNGRRTSIEELEKESAQRPHMADALARAKTAGLRCGALLYGSTNTNVYGVLALCADGQIRGLHHHGVTGVNVHADEGLNLYTLSDAHAEAEEIARRSRPSGNPMDVFKRDQGARP